MISMNASVGAGAALLDLEHKGWKDKIDCNTLRMDHESNCIIGQLYGDYFDGLHKLNIGWYGRFDLGFNAVANIPQLEQLWIEQINARKSK